MDIQIIASKFKGKNIEGDFNYMIKRDMNLETDPLTLYIYNDNTELYYSRGYRIGAGNAVIRQYNKYNPKMSRPFSAGIPTGSFAHGGFENLNQEAIIVINDSIKIIENIIKQYSIKKIYYSTNNSSGILGKSLFKVDDDVLTYITDKIKKLSIKPIIVNV